MSEHYFHTVLTIIIMSQLEGLIVKESVEHEAESTHTESVFVQADAVLCSSLFL